MMKKIFTAFLALTFLTSASGISLASTVTPPVDGASWFTKWKKGASINSNIKKHIKFENEAEARTGNSVALANNAVTNVDADSRAVGLGDGLATNDSQKKVDNNGNALSYSGNTDALNDATNCDEECIKDTASTQKDVRVTIDADIEGFVGGVIPVGNRSTTVQSTKKGGDSASVAGDIDIKVEFENEAEAKSGDTFATGNTSFTCVDSDDRAIARGCGDAANKNDVCVTNNGEAVAYSGNAVATNEAQNTVKIDIERKAESCKKIDIFAELTADLDPCCTL
jgi:hypothetical protein